MKLLAAIAALALSSCSQPNQTETPEEVRGFRAPGSLDEIASSLPLNFPNAAGQYGLTCWPKQLFVFVAAPNPAPPASPSSSAAVIVNEMSFEGGLDGASAEDAPDLLRFKLPVSPELLGALAASTDLSVTYRGETLEAAAVEPGALAQFAGACATATGVSLPDTSAASEGG